MAEASSSSSSSSSSDKPEDRARERNLTQLAEARKKAAAKARETKRLKEERLREIEQKLESTMRPEPKKEKEWDEPVVVTKKAAAVDREEPQPKKRVRFLEPETERGYFSSSTVEIARTLGAGALSLASLWLANRMKSGSIQAAPQPVVQAPTIQAPLEPPQPEPLYQVQGRGIPRTGSVPSAPARQYVATPGVHKSGFTL